MSESDRSMAGLGVMQIIDSLQPGGAERVAVDIANGLARRGYRSFLCVTRFGGALDAVVDPRVQRVDLHRRGRFSPRALLKLSSFVRVHRVQVLHAHASSVFFAVQCRFLCPQVRVVWHDHYGALSCTDRPVTRFRLVSRRIDGIVSVNESLACWARDTLHYPHDRVWLVPNGITEPSLRSTPPVLPGQRGGRIVCVANFRPQKDHQTLIRAFTQVAKAHSEATLLLVGASCDREHVQSLKQEAGLSGVGERVCFLGQRDDVSDILSRCDIGALSSQSEGLPLALLEYGMAGLPVVSTDVGQCAAVLEGGKHGVLVRPSEPEALAQAILGLLGDRERRDALGSSFRRHVQAHYGIDRMVNQIAEVYRQLGSYGRD